jgi:hypothetical protein
MLDNEPEGWVGEKDDASIVVPATDLDVWMGTAEVTSNLKGENVVVPTVP